MPIGKDTYEKYVNLETAQLTEDGYVMPIGTKIQCMKCENLTELTKLSIRRTPRCPQCNSTKIALNDKALKDSSDTTETPITTPSTKETVPKEIMEQLLETKNYTKYYELCDKDTLLKEWDRRAHLEYEQRQSLKDVIEQKQIPCEDVVDKGTPTPTPGPTPETPAPTVDYETQLREQAATERQALEEAELKRKATSPEYRKEVEDKTDEAVKALTAKQLGQFNTLGGTKVFVDIIIDIHKLAFEKAKLDPLTQDEDSRLVTSWTLLIDFYLPDIATWIKYLPVLMVIMTEISIILPRLGKKSDKDKAKPKLTIDDLRNEIRTQFKALLKTTKTKTFDEGLKIGEQLSKDLKEKYGHLPDFGATVQIEMGTVLTNTLTGMQEVTALAPPKTVTQKAPSVNYDKASFGQLKNIAKNRGIKLFHMNRAKLIIALRKGDKK